MILHDLFENKTVAEGEITESVFSPAEIAAINQYLDDEISFIELRRGYPRLFTKAARQFGMGSARGFRGEMDFYDRMAQARDEGDIMEQGVAEGWRATGGRDNAGGQSYGIDNSDGTIGRGYKPGKHYSSSSSTVEIKSEPKHPLHGKQVTNGKVTGRLMGTEHQGTVAKIKHSSGMIHHVDAKEIRKMKEDQEINFENFVTDFFMRLSKEEQN